MVSRNTPYSFMDVLKFVALPNGTTLKETFLRRCKVPYFCVQTNSGKVLKPRTYGNFGVSENQRKTAR